MRKNILITGSSGYIGSQVISLLDHKKYDKIYLLSRHKINSSKANVVWKKWSLGDELDSLFFKKIDIVLHIAHEFDIKKSDSLLSNINYKGTIKLANFFVARNPQCRFIFISTTSAHKSALNLYGQTKIIIEEYLLSNFNNKNILILRVGSIFGSVRKSFYGLFFNLLKISPVCIVPYKAIPLQIIHLDVVLSSIIYALNRSVHGRFVLAGENIYFGEYLRLIRRKATGRNILLFPIPQFLIIFFTKLVSLVPLAAAINLAERINGLISANSDRGDKFHEKFKITSNNQHSVLKKSSSRRAYLVDLIFIFRLLGIYSKNIKLRLIVRNFENTFGDSNSFSSLNILINYVLIRVLPTPFLMKFSSKIYIRKILISLTYKSIKFPNSNSMYFFSLVFAVIGLPFLLLNFKINNAHEN